MIRVQTNGANWRNNPRSVTASATGVATTSQAAPPITKTRRGRPPKAQQGGNCKSPSNETVFQTKTVSQRFAEIHGEKPTTKQLTRILIAGGLQLAQLRAERKLSKTPERRYELTESIEGVLTDICALLEIATVRTAVINALLKDYANPARKEFLEQADDDKSYRVRRFADELTTERRLLVGFYGAKRDRMLTQQSHLSKTDEDFSPDQKLELAVCVHRFAALRDRNGERMQAERLKAEVSSLSRSFGHQPYGWMRQAIDTNLGIDLSVKS